MSPEQVTGSEVDSRSDLFSLGILLYLMLAGEKPFAGDTAAVIFKIVYEDPVPPSRLRPELATGHDYLVLRSLVKDPKKRYGSAREFLEDLDDVQNGRPPRSEVNFPLAEIRTGERTMVARGAPLPWRVQNAPAPWKKWTWVMGGMGAGAAFLLVLLGLGSWMYRIQNKSVAPMGPVVSPAPQGTPSPRSLPVSGPKKEPSQSPNGETAGATTVAKLPPSRKPPGDAVAVASHSPSGQGKDKIATANIAGPTGAPPAAAKGAATQPNAGARVVQLTCKFELQDATLTVSNEAKVIFHEILKGQKRGGLLHPKGGFGGSLTRPIPIPAGTRTLTLHVESKDGILEKPFVLPPANSPGTLQVLLTADRLSVHWVAPARP